MAKTKTTHTDAEKPYFLNNPKWYYEGKNYEADDGTLKLTKDAPPKARESYKEFFKMPKANKDGFVVLN